MSLRCLLNTWRFTVLKAQQPIITKKITNLSNENIIKTSHLLQIPLTKLI
ncbi:hypothetical protein EC50588_A0117 [Escherichia coli 5.0588]|nr:hypothetical protein EC50588_A0117 [Escherichia coli 5.0588]